MYIIKLTVPKASQMNEGSLRLNLNRCRDIVMDGFVDGFQLRFTSPGDLKRVILRFTADGDQTKKVFLLSFSGFSPFTLSQVLSRFLFPLKSKASPRRHISSSPPPVCRICSQWKFLLSISFSWTGCSELVSSWTPFNLTDVFALFLHVFLFNLPDISFGGRAGVLKDDPGLLAASSDNI